MTDHIARLYAACLTLALFFVIWAAIAAHPWAEAKQPADPRLAALAQREARLQRDAKLVQQILDRRWAVHRQALAVRRRENRATDAAARAAAASAAAARAATPTVRVVTLPPIAVTRSS